MGGQIEYIMRVKLPSSCAYHSSPSGDTEYDVAYSKAISDALPVGFEVSWSTRQLWPQDRDGFTWVKLYCTDEQSAMETWRSECVKKQNILTEVGNVIKSLSKKLGV